MESLMRRLALHSLTYLVLLVAVMAAIPPSSSFSSDDGAYAGQVAALRQGSWVLERPVPVVDAANEGWLNTAITPEGPLPYTTSPAYVRLLTAIVDVVHGEADTDEQAGSLGWGLHVVPVLAAVAAAIAAWLVAERYHPPSAPSAFWLLAIGPTLVNATTLWAHTLATALGGFAVLALLVATDRGRSGADVAVDAVDDSATPLALAFAAAVPATAPADTFDPIESPAAATIPAGAAPSPDGGNTAEATAHRPDREVSSSAASTSRFGPALGVVGLAVTLTAAGAIRTEGLFWVAAVASTGLVRARTWTMRAATGAAGFAGGVAWLAGRRWGATLRADQLPIETSVEVLNGGPGWLAGRLPAAWLLLVNGPTGDLGPLFTVVAVSAVGAAVYLSHRPDRSGIRPEVLLTVAAVAYGIRLVLAPDQPIGGLFGAWPAMAAAIGIGARRLTANDDHGGPALWPIAAPAGLLTLAVLATQYASSGGLQWGGRYLSFGFVPLAVLAAVAGRAAIERHPRALAALVAIPALIGIIVTINLHRHHAEAVAQASAGGPDVVITESPALPRIAWGELPIAFYRATDDDVEALLSNLADAEVAVVNVHGLSSNDLSAVTDYEVTELDGPVRRLELLGIDGSPGVDPVEEARATVGEVTEP